MEIVVFRNKNHLTPFLKIVQEQQKQFLFFRIYLICYIKILNQNMLISY